jgi:cytochrome c oxidase cbb3-type subunit 1
MEPFVRNFIRASLVWLGGGVLLGLYLAAYPAAIVYRPAHVHANLLGFVSMMIFGVAYHVIPRFAGVPLRSRGAARAHLWIANAGLGGLVTGWLLRPNAWHAGSIVIIIGGTASALGAFLCIGNIWATLSAVRRPAITPLLRTPS